MKKPKILKKLSSLETIEEKSFWIIAPTVALLGVAGLFTAGFYSSPLPTIISAILCLIIPIILMYVVQRYKNYHTAYPILCVSIGAISIPVTFVFSGGFLSGMPLFCTITTAVSAMCYSPKFRTVSFICCIVGNTIAFIYVYFFRTPFPLFGTESLYQASMDGVRKAIYNDVLFGYYCSAFGLFVAISLITSDIRKYRLNQDTLQRYFDVEKRKEIFKRVANDGNSSLVDHKKAAILFADISGFTPITEKMSSDTIREFLNEFFTTAGKHIHTSGGIIDKYIGDCIMAYWFEDEHENCVLEAVNSMLNLKNEIFKNEEEIFMKFGVELNFTVGLAYGDVIFGDIGSESMHDYTVIGDAVNTASRIQDSATSGEMLISDEAASKIKEFIQLEEVDDNRCYKGKNKPIALYRVIGKVGKTTYTEVKIKDSYGYKLHVCGCRGSFPVSGSRFSEYGGETSCYVVRKNDYAVIIDCGTGLKNAMKVVEGCKKIDILLTHVHYDHILGFLMSKFPSDADITIYGRFCVWASKSNTLKDFMEHPYWPVEIVKTKVKEVEIDKEITLKEGMKATFYNSDHPDHATVIKLMCNDRKIVFFADCEDANKLDPKVAQDSDLLFYDGMFDDNDSVDHTGWGHGTWQSGIRFLKGRNIKKLVITHHNPEVGDHSLMLKEEKAREAAQNVSFAKSGDIFTI